MRLMKVSEYRLIQHMTKENENGNALGRETLPVLHNIHVYTRRL